MKSYSYLHVKPLASPFFSPVERVLCVAPAADARAVNPHELVRVLECQSIITVGEIIIHASLARKAGNPRLDFMRLDYPDMDPPEWRKLLPLKSANGEVVVRELALDHHLREPYAPTYEENYKGHCDI